jgi:hypothetical protein
MRLALRLALLSLLALSSSRAAVAPQGERSSLSLQVEPQSEVCFYEDVPANTRVEALIMVYRGGKLDVGLRIEAVGSSGVLYDKMIFSNVDDRTGSLLPTIVKKGHSFVTAAAGLYGFCINNKMARWTAKVLTLDLNIGGSEAPGAQADGSVVKAAAPGSPVPEGLLTSQDESASAQMASMRGFSSRLMRQLTLLFEATAYHRQRSTRHHKTLLFLESRVSWWSLAETVVIVLVFCLEVIVVRSWFAEESTGSLVPPLRMPSSMQQQQRSYAPLPGSARSSTTPFLSSGRSVEPSGSAMLRAGKMQSA